MNIDFDTYKKKVYGAYVGKSVGGTLGMPFEGSLDSRTLSYYDPVPDKMLPNDDLDLQVINLETLLSTGFPVSRLRIGSIWLNHLEDSAPDEYGVAIANHKAGLRAPIAGKYRNKFTAGMGSAIRSELWACIAPANPELAATLAKEDACTDHSDDGVYAEAFLAAAESAAFIENDLSKLIEIGLKYVGKESKLHRAFRFTIEEWQSTKDVMQTREAILRNFPTDNWTDVNVNLSFILLSLLSCEGSFDKAICTAASLGYDTDCTAATVGAIFGIMNPDGITEKWTRPIGNELVLSACIINSAEWSTINEFCDAVIFAAGKAQAYYRTNVSLGVPENYGGFSIAEPRFNNFKPLYERNDNESLAAELPALVSLVYPETVAAIPQKDNAFALKIAPTDDENLKGTVRIAAPNGFSVFPAEFDFDLNGKEKVFPLTVTAKNPKKRAQRNLFTFFVTINGVTAEIVAGVPLSRVFDVKDLSTGKTHKEEIPSSFFTVPDGEYEYRARFKATAKKQARVSCGGTRPFVLKINGKTVFDGDGKFYNPTFHRDDSWTTAELLKGDNELTIYFPRHEKGEAFLGFGTTFGCSTWLDSIEFYS